MRQQRLKLPRMHTYAKIWLLAVFVAALVLLAGTAAGESKATNAAIGAEEFYRQALSQPPKTISPKRLARWIDQNSVVLIDLRSAAEYQAGHLRGAIHIALTELTEQALERLGISTDARIVVYCDYQLVPTRRIALTTLGHPTLQQLGFDKVYTLQPLWQSPDCKNRWHDQPCAEFLPWDEPAAH